MRKTFQLFIMAFLILSLLTDFSCSKGDEATNSSNHQEENAVDTIGPTLSKEIVGDWAYYSGDTLCGYITDTTNKLYSQELSFVSNGNYSELLFTSSNNEEQNGNWKIERNKLVLNNWNGAFLQDTLIINSLSATELILSYQNKTLEYKRSEWLYNSDNFCKEILGFWKTMESRFPRHTYTFNSDGTVGHHDYVWENVGGYGVHPWSYNPQTRELTTSQPTTGSEIRTTKVEFINAKYFRWFQTFMRNQ